MGEGRPAWVKPGARFHLMRFSDVSGVSGTGVVAVGVMLPSGRVVLEWRPPDDGIIVYRSLDEVFAVHGHDGRTFVREGWPEAYPWA